MKGGSFMGKIDWDVVTNFTDAVTTTLKTVTFPKVQEQVYLRNQGNANFTYTIGSQSGTLTPGQSVTVNQDVSSFTLQAVSGTHTFEVRAKEKGTEIIEVDNVSSGIPSDVSTQLTEKVKKKDAFLKRLINSEVTKIKLIGDSTTAGLGSAGWSTPSATGRLIINRAGYGNQYEPNTDSAVLPSWANLFRQYINTKYPAIDFFNMGVPGIATSEIWGNYMSQLCSSSEDVVFVMLGLNDRTTGNASGLSAYQTNLQNLLSYVNQRCKTMIVMSPAPALDDFTDTTYTTYAKDFGSREIDNIITKVCSDNNYTHISLYRKFLDYASYTKTKLSDLMKDVNDAHPNDKGYSVMWKVIQTELGFMGQLTNWIETGYKDVVHRSGYDKALNSTLLTSFQQGSVTYDIISGVNPEKANFPEATSGTLITFYPVVSSANAWGYQEYHIYQTNTIYRRYWTGTAWSTWAKDGTVVPISIDGWFDGVVNSTALTAFTAQKVSYNNISAGNTEIANFPEGHRGVLVTYRPIASLDAYGYQEFHIEGTSKKYKRYWTGSAWGTWDLISSHINVASLPTASVTYQGKFRMVVGAPNVADQLYFCRKKSDNTYEWVQLTT
jgi:lysophospholipase L1-like esterase